MKNRAVLCHRNFCTALCPYEQFCVFLQLRINEKFASPVLLCRKSEVRYLCLLTVLHTKFLVNFNQPLKPKLIFSNFEIE